MRTSVLLSLLLVACGGGRSGGDPTDTGTVPSTTTAPPPSTVDTGSVTTAPTTDTAVPTEAHELRMDGSRAVDLLFVIDDSCSMVDDQALLAQGFGQAMVAIVGSGVDWHVGVVTTDMRSNTGQGKLRRTTTGEMWLHPEHADVDDAFETLVTPGDGGDGDEKGLDALYAALDTHATTFNAGFVRPLAQLHAIVLSDEDDRSDGLPIDLADLPYWFEGLKPTPELAVFHAVVTTSAGTFPGQLGQRYIDLADATGGQTADIASISAADYADLADVLIPPTPTPVLEPEPVAGSVTVAFEHADGSVTELVEGVDFAVVPGTGAASIEWLGTESQAGDTIVVAWEALP